MTSGLLVPPPYDVERDDWGAILLGEWATSYVSAGLRVLIVGAGAGGVGLPLARAGAMVTFADDHVGALAAARQSFAQARLTAEFVTTLELAPTEPFDLALLNILWWTDAERGAELIALAVQHLRAGGVVAVGGGKNAGIGRVERDLKNIVGSSAAVIYKKGHRVLAAQRPATWSPPERHATTNTITVGDHTLLVAQTAGVFADSGLDPATALLLASIDMPAAARVLDLGCGAGILGMIIARMQPSVDLTLVDSNVIAVATTERNLAQNGISARVLASDGVAAVRAEQFDLVVTNPPFHVGRTRTDAIARRFISESHAVLRPGGALWLVANRFLKYEPDLQAAFGNVAERAGDERYKVLQATK